MRRGTFRWRRGLSLLASLTLAEVSGCGAPNGRGQLNGTLYVAECTGRTSPVSLGTPAAPAPFTMKPIYFEADVVDDFPHANMANRLLVRIQPSGLSVDEADAFLLNITDSRQVAQQLGAPMPLGPSTNVRATLQLPETCPDTPVQMELDGTITFSRFGDADKTPVPANFIVNYGDALTATFDVRVIDRRALTLGGTGAVSTTPMVGGQLSGAFDFTVKSGQPGQRF